MNLDKVIRFLSYVVVAAVTATVTMFLCAGRVSNEGYTKLEQLEDLIEQRFIAESDSKAMADAAAAAMVDSLGDRWSHYMTAEQYQSYAEQMNNSYVGIGITITVREDGAGVDVVDVTKGGPAEAAGVLTGDILVSVEGQKVAEIGVDEAKKLIRGEEGTTVEVTFLRGEEELTLQILRAQIETPVAEGQMLEGNVGLVTIVNFDKRCCQETVAVIEQLLAQGGQGLIFDVRYNPGGYKNELVDLLNYLLPEGVLFRSENYAGKTWVDESDADCLELPMAVLVNESSYSAAEFFAAALREYDWAVVVGTQTSGKGYFQETYKLNDGSAVALSVGKYCTPNGVSLAGVGITPDRIVEVDEQTAAMIYYDQLAPQEDPQILAALEALEIS